MIYSSVIALSNNMYIP